LIIDFAKRIGFTSKQGHYHDASELQTRAAKKGLGHSYSYQLQKLQKI